MTSYHLSKLKVPCFVGLAKIVAHSYSFRNFFFWSFVVFVVSQEARYSPRLIFLWSEWQYEGSFQHQYINNGRQ